MPYLKRKILILLASGSVLSTRGNRSIVFIDSKEDEERWLSELPELFLLASIDTYFIKGETQLFNLDAIEKIASSLMNHHDAYDGFVVLVRGEHMVQAAVAAEFMLQGFGKPIIFTGSRYAPEAVPLQDMKRIIKMGGLGLRSNITNAVHLATTAEFPGTAIMFGNKIIKPTKAVVNDFYSMNLFKSIDDQYLGRIDFGISLAKQKPPAQKEFITKSLSRNVSIAYSEQLNELISPNNPLSDGAKKTLLVKLAPNGVIPPEIVNRLIERYETIIGFNERYVLQQSGIVELSKLTWDAAQIKTRWAQAVAKNGDEFVSLLRRDCIGEFLS